MVREHKIWIREANYEDEILIFDGGKFIKNDSETIGIITLHSFPKSFLSSYCELDRNLLGESTLIGLL